MSPATAIPLRPDMDSTTGEVIERLDRPAFVTKGEPQDLAKLFAKMAHVLEGVQRVPKLGRNEQQKYDYATEGDLLDTIRPLLAKQGIAVIPTVVHSEQSREQKKTTTRVILQVAFCCAETGAMLITTWHGEADDWGDKSYWKAYTGTLKYAHFKTWMVSTGDDPEAEAEEGAEPAQPQAKRQQRAAAPKQDSKRTEWHERILGTINERRKLLPDGYACTIGNAETTDLKGFIRENWEPIRSNVELAKKAAAAIDAALKELNKQKRSGKNGAAERTEEDNRKKLHARYMALLSEKAPGLAKHEADRHRFQAEVVGKESTADWGIGDYEKAILAIQDGTASSYDLPM